MSHSYAPFSSVQSGFMSAARLVQRIKQGKEQQEQQQQDEEEVEDYEEEDEQRKQQQEQDNKVESLWAPLNVGSIVSSPLANINPTYPELYFNVILSLPRVVNKSHQDAKHSSSEKQNPTVVCMCVLANKQFVLPNNSCFRFFSIIVTSLLGFGITLALVEAQTNPRITPPLCRYYFVLSV